MCMPACGDGAESALPGEAIEETQELLRNRDPESIPADYVKVPGGWAHPSCIHEVPDGAVVDDARGDVLLNGKVIAHHDKCAFPPRVGRPSEGTGSGPLAAGYGGHIMYTNQTQPANTPFYALAGQLTVPNGPSTATPQTVYYYNGVQSTVDANCGVLQPVLQWGQSPAGGGAFWAIGSWFWGAAGQFHSALSRVNVGDKLHFQMLHTNGQPWSVLARDMTTGASRTISLNNACRYNWAFPAVLEIDTSHPMTTCTQVPALVQFSNISLAAGAVADVPYAPASFIDTNAPACGWTVSTLFRVTTLKARLGSP